MTAPHPRPERPRTRLARIAAAFGATVLAATAIVAIGTAAPAHAATPLVSCGGSADCKVLYQDPGVGEFTVPDGVTSVRLDVRGASGSGLNRDHQAMGGYGGRTTGTLAVSPGQVLSVLVGTFGVAPDATRYGGGGAPGGPETALGPGGGGSFVFDAGGSLLAAAGGGGGGGEKYSGGAGAGAGDNGSDGVVEPSWGMYGSTASRGGTQSGGGSGGQAGGANGSGPAGNFSPGNGGQGGYVQMHRNFAGAGGGGGYYGGGGGGSFHGGAGGSGYAARALTNVSSQTGVQWGHGTVTITYGRSPAKVDLSASPASRSVEGESVTLTAEVQGTLATPTGYVTFMSDDWIVWPCLSVPLDSFQRATCTTSQLPLGTRSYVAEYSGDDLLAPASSTLSHQVVRAPLVLTTATLPDATVGEPYSTQLTAEGGLAPYTWSVSEGTLPPGLSLSASGVLSGTPTGVGNGSPVTITVQDAQGTPYTTTATWVLTVTQAGLGTAPEPAGSLDQIFGFGS